MSDDKPESTIDVPFQARSDACVMVRLKIAEHHTVSLAAFAHAALRLLPVGASLTGNLALRCLKNSPAETLRP